MTDAPRELAALRERTAELVDLRALRSLQGWDQQTMMPPAGGAARAEQAATLERVCHAKLVDPEVGRLLDALERWRSEQDPDSDDARLLAHVQREHEKAVRVPGELAAAMARAGSLGQEAWMAARAASDFGRLHDSLAEQLELRRRYIACFDGHAHPYDVLLDDFEPGMTTAELTPLLERLRDALVPLVARCSHAPEGPVIPGSFPLERQRDATLAVVRALGFDRDGWRLDTAAHPFATSLSPNDVRITTRYDEHDFAVTFYSVLHEFGHGLYEAGVPERLARTPLGSPDSLGLHESQSRLWENLVGRSRAFCTWVLPRLREQLGDDGLEALDAERLYRGVNRVRPSLIRVEADEATYNLHIALRFELELALVEGRVEVAELPSVWNEGMQRLLGIEVPDDARGVLQDIHWSMGAFGYFPTYSLGNLIAAQLWSRAAADIGDLDGAIARGDFAALRDWLRERVHAHGSKHSARELLGRVTGEELREQPFLDYLRAKLEDTGTLVAA